MAGRIVAGRIVAWHIHHDTLLEVLTEPISTRRAFIKERKPAHEVALRLKLLKVVKDQKTAKEILGADYEGRPYRDKLKALHEKECPNCPFRPKHALAGDLFTLASTRK
jgi:hypothetical protein